MHAHFDLTDEYLQNNNNNNNNGISNGLDSTRACTCCTRNES